MGFCSKGEKLDSTPNTTKKSGNYRQGAGGGWGEISSDGKLLRGNRTKGRGRFWLN